MSEEEQHEAYKLMAQAFLAAIEGNQEVDVGLLQEICEAIIDESPIDLVELLHEALGTP